MCVQLVPVVWFAVFGRSCSTRDGLLFSIFKLQLRIHESVGTMNTHNAESIKLHIIPLPSVATCTHNESNVLDDLCAWTSIRHVFRANIVYRIPE